VTSATRNDFFILLNQIRQFDFEDDRSIGRDRTAA
jgi:hypothetical protein